MNRQQWRRLVALAQSAEYVSTGIWPLLSMRTLEAVTWPKVDRWLVKTVGVLVIVTGSVVGLAAVRGKITGEIALLGAGSGAGLGAIDVWYALRGRISPVYLADAVAQIALVAGWAKTAGPCDDE